MSLIPTFSPIEPQWRGNTSSEDLNSNFEEILYDLNVIYAEASSLVVDLNELESRIRHDATALSARLYAVSGLITAYDSLASTVKMFHEDFFLTKNIAYPNDLQEENRCVVNADFGVVTLPVNNSFSKVYTLGMSDGKVTVSPDLEVEVTAIDEDGIVSLEELNPLRAFDGEESTVWERKARFNRDYVKSSARCMMEVTLPSMSNPYVNKLSITPYPEGMLDLQVITYDTLISQDNVLPSFPADGLNNIKSTLFSFDNIEPYKLKFYFRQRNDLLEDGYKTFTYGAKEIAIEKVEYKTSGKIAVKFTLPSYESGLLNTITNLSTDPNYDNIKYKLYLYATDSDFQSDNPVWTSSNSPITPSNPLDVSSYTSESVWIMVELVQESGETGSPLLNSITVTYTTS